MNKLNISEWKEFVIGDLFDIKRPNSRTVKGYDDGSIPFVSSGNFNNGIDRFVTPLEDEKLDKGNCITISPVDGSCFYQPIDFLGRGGGGSSIILLYNDNLNEKIGLFISVIIRKTLSKFYQYNNMGNSNSIKQEKIKLPPKNNQPDWEYMENFIDNIYKRESICAVAEYIKKNTDKTLDVSEWREYQIKKLFDISPTSYHKLTNKYLLDMNGLNPVVANSSYNNGIVGYSFHECTEKGNIITFSDTTTADSIFYQPVDFVGYSHIQKLTPILYQENWTKNSLLFFTIVFRAKAKRMNFDYTNKFTRKNALDLFIKLPTKNNQPDWEYMENFIDNIYKRERARASVLLHGI